jgi:hypothetical protein
MSTRSILVLFIVLAVLGWVGLAFFTYYNPPDAWNRGIVVIVLWVTLWATLLPLVYWIHLRRQRLPRTPVPTTQGGIPKRGVEDRGTEEGIVPRAARQSALAALFITLCLWLRMVRALNWAYPILLLLLLVLAEVLLATRRVGN